MTSPSTDNYTLGKGIVYFNKKLTSTTWEGFRDLGNSPEFTFTIDLTALDHFSSRGGLRAKDKKVISEVSPACAFTLDEITSENLALLTLSTITSVTQAADEAYSDTFTGINLGRYYEATKRALLPPTYLKYDGGTVIFVVGEVVSGATGVGTITALLGDSTAGIMILNTVTAGFVDDEAITGGGSGVAVADGAEVTPTLDILVSESDGSVIYVKDTDYTYTAASGMVYIKTGGTVADDDDIAISYAYGAASYEQLDMLAVDTIEGEIMFRSDNPIGNDMVLNFWNVSLTPAGDTAMIGEDWSTIAFEGEILKDTTNHPSSPYGKIEIDV